MVSVIIPYKHDGFYETRLGATLKSIENQEGCDDLEIIVFEVGQGKSLELSDYDVKHFLLEHSSHFNPALPRNSGAKMAEGETLYFNDADIFLQNPTYLASLEKRLEENKGCFLTSPKLLRLCRREFDNFYSRLMTKGFKNFLDELKNPQPYLITLDNESELVVFEKEEGGEQEVHLADKQDFNEYINSGLEGEEPRFWTLNVHRGGLMVRKDNFERVGGYCTGYKGWGCEDEDLIWKLNHFLKQLKIEESVLHLDHPRDYFDKRKWLRNKEFLESRKLRGFMKVVRGDRKAYENLQVL